MPTQDACVGWIISLVEAEDPVPSKGSLRRAFAAVATAIRRAIEDDKFPKPRTSTGCACEARWDPKADPLRPSSIGCRTEVPATRKGEGQNRRTERAST
jgi:hypothetical protein